MPCLKNSILRRTLLALAALWVCPFQAHADTFLYSFTDPDLTFSLSTQTLVTTASAPLPAIECDFLGIPCSAVVIGVTGVPDFEFVHNDLPGFEVFDAKGMGAGGEVQSYPASFFTVGEHAYAGGTLDILDIPGSVTPEPSTFALLGTGLLGVAGVVRRRFA